MSIIDILKDKLNVQEEQIKDNSLIVEDLGADSLSVVEIIMDVEEEFDIQIPDEDAELILTVKDLADYIAENGS
jgi:acyl carrier protein|tara:strand:- start:102 stop:323 length:222 start_codon:yes stop_codon:yes gene_type:complete